MEHKEALELFGDISQDEAHNRAQFLKSMQFFNGDQWPDALRRMRESDPNGARPCLTINVLPHHVKQVVNEMRQNRPAIKILPVDNGADIKTAQALQGMCRHIENASDADVVYGTGGKTAVIGGIGYWRVMSEYLDEEYGLQELRLKRIINPLTVYMSRCDCPAGSDADDVFITSLIHKNDYKRIYRKSAPDSLPTQGTGDDTWLVDDYVRVAEWYHVEKTEVAAVVLPSGQRARRTDIEALQKESGKSVEYNSEAKITERKVIWRKMNGEEFLKEQTEDGKYIPVVRVIGQEIDIEGKRYYYGMVRDAIDPQRMRNYWRSCETEMIALAPKAPFIGAAGAFDSFESSWQKANVQNMPYLEYNATDAQGNPIPMPMRQPSAPIPAAMIQAAQNADWDIKATMGQFGASLGEPSEEKSGKAINARKIESDASTFDYVDNLGISVRHTGRILVDLIPKKYDTPRIQRILGEDGEAKMMRLDPQMQGAFQETKESGIDGIFNPGVGRYDVEVSVGPTFTTKRQEAAEGMAQILQGNPELWRVAGDLFAKMQDWPGADVLAERLKKTIPPELMDDDEQEEHNPQDVAMIQKLDQTVQAMSAELEQMQQVAQEAEAQKKAMETDRAATQAKIEADKDRLALDTYKAETERMKVIADKPQIIELLKGLGMGEQLTEEPADERAEWEIPEGELVPPELIPQDVPVTESPMM